MSMGAIKARLVSCALPAILFFCGCATHDASQSIGDQEQQIAGTRQVIVVPVFILSSPQDSPNGGGDVLPAPHSPDPSTRRGVPLPTKT